MKYEDIELHQACKTFFESWFGAPLGQPEYMVRILARSEETKKEFADTLYRFVRIWQKSSPEYNAALDSLEMLGRLPNTENILKARIAKLEDALKYYANSDWDSGCQCCISDTKSATNPVMDEGQRAREALKDE